MILSALGIIMNILALVCFVLALLMAEQVRRLKRKLDATVRENAAENLDRDNTLDWLLRHYQLHIEDPFIYYPSISSKKKNLPLADITARHCYHCHVPSVHGHTPDCPWVLMQPMVQHLYHTPTPTASTPLISFGS